MDSHGRALQELTKRSCGGLYSAGQTHLFISLDDGPLWILETVEEQCYRQGKLLCPKCQGRLGSFDLIRVRPCYCGETTLPTVHLLCDRIDICDLNAQLDQAARLAGCGRSVSVRLRTNRTDSSLCDSETSDPGPRVSGSEYVHSDAAGAELAASARSDATDVVGGAGARVGVLVSGDRNCRAPSELTGGDESLKNRTGFLLKSLPLSLPLVHSKRKHITTQSNQSCRRSNNDTLLECAKRDEGQCSAQRDKNKPSSTPICFSPTTRGHTSVANSSSDTGVFELDWDDDGEDDREEQRQVDSVPLEKRFYGLSSFEKEMLKIAREKEKERQLEAEGVPWDFACPLCLEVMLHPYTTSPCKHNFCQGCLRHLSSACSQRGNVCCCPLCRKPISCCVQNSALAKLLTQKCPLHIKKRLEDEKRFHSRYRNFPLPGTQGHTSYLISTLLRVRATSKVRWAMMIVTAFSVMALSYVGMGICRQVLSVSAEVFDSVTERLTGERLWSEFMGMESRMLTVSCWFVLYLVCSWVVMYLRNFRPIA